jgi:hypothetical protein
MGSTVNKNNCDPIMRGYSNGIGLLAGLDTFVPLKTGLSTTLRCRVATTLFGVRDKVSQGSRVWNLDFGIWNLPKAVGNAGSTSLQRMYLSTEG